MAQPVNSVGREAAMGLGLLVFQGTILSQLGGINLLPVFVVYLSNCRGCLAGLAMVMLLGLAESVFTSTPAGLESLVYMMAFLSGYLVHGRLHLGHPLHQMGLVLAALIVQRLLAGLVFAGLPLEWRDWIKIAVAVAATPFVIGVFTFLDGLRIIPARAKPAE